MEPIRAYCRNRYPDLNEQDIENLVLNNMKQVENVEELIFRWVFDHVNASKQGLFDIMCIDISP
jgi:hypothetical protein